MIGKLAVARCVFPSPNGHSDEATPDERALCRLWSFLCLFGRHRNRGAGCTELPCHVAVTSEV